MNVKKRLGLVILITLILTIALYLVVDFTLVPQQAHVATLLKRPVPNEFYFYDVREYNFTNRNDIYEFNSLLADKVAQRVKNATAKKLFEKKIAIFDWGYKGRTIVVSENGRILIYVPKPDIRNTSRVHWLWWKLNVAIDRNNSITYITDADQQVADKILEIKRKLKN